MAFDQILKKNFWAVILVLVAIVAFLNAQGVMQLVGSALAVDEKALAAPPPAPKVLAVNSAGSTHALSAEPILTRNPFDSVTGDLHKRDIPEDDTQAAAQLDLSDPMHAPPCDGVKVLVIAASADPDWSFAALSASGDNKSVLRRRGGEVGSKTVKFIGWDRVWMTSGATLCQAEMFKPAQVAEAKPAPAAPAPMPAPAAGAGGVDPAIAKGIVKVSANEFNVDRGVVDKILENQAELMRQARIVPEQENGKVVGIRLFGVRPETLLGVLGMENGDRLQTINGFDMTSPEKALEAYARLRTAEHLTIQINRRGQNQNLDYNIK
jgi:general secretion pathway protein C